MSMENKVVLVTGGAQGIGKAAAKKFASAGAIVAIADYNPQIGEASAQELGVEFYCVNVADRKAVQAWVDDVYAKHERIDVLINNAGVTRDAMLVSVKEGVLVKQMEESAFDTVISINLKGVFNCAQAVAPYMIKQGSGVILNVASVVGLYGNFGQTNYVATKAGVIGMTKVWARELGKKGIRVNAIAPGFIESEMTAKMPATVLDDMKGKTPLGRLGLPEEIANTFFWLASDEASYVHGTVISVDGGLVLGT